MRKIRELREAAGLTQEGLAHAAGISTSLVQKIENGRVNPTARKLVAIAGALGVDVGELFAEQVA